MRRTRYRRQSDPTPGLFLTGLFSAPYLANAFKSFPRGVGHDVVLATGITLLWGTYFCWERIRTHLPGVHKAIVVFLGLWTLGAIGTLYGTVIYLLVIR